LIAKKELQQKTNTNITEKKNKRAYTSHCPRAIEFVD
jgi:hypothetical protein